MWFLAVLFFVGLLISFTAGAKKNSVPARQASLSPRKEKTAAYVFEKLPTGKGILFSETYSNNHRRAPGKAASGDLWLHGSDGQKRLIADAVVHAGFSPDGRKLAYMTADHDLHIETIDGKSLACLQRIHDHNWSSDSMTIIVSAMVSVDYPELRQTVVYDLNSGKMLPLSNGK